MAHLLHLLFKSFSGRQKKNIAQNCNNFFFLLLLRVHCGIMNVNSLHSKNVQKRQTCLSLNCFSVDAFWGFFALCLWSGGDLKCTWMSSLYKTPLATCTDDIISVCIKPSAFTELLWTFITLSSYIWLDPYGVGAWCWQLYTLGSFYSQLCKLVIKMSGKLGVHP